MYLPNILDSVQRNFSPDKKFNFRVRFPNMDTGYQFSGSGADGPGFDPCPYLSWFPAKSVNVPVGWFVTETSLDYFMISVPVPNKINYLKIQLTIELDRYKKIENWLERWYETIANGGKHIGTLREIMRPFQVVKTYSNPLQAISNSSIDASNGFNVTTWYVFPTGQVTDMLEYSSGTKNITVDFNVVGKFADSRAMNRPAKQF